MLQHVLAQALTSKECSIVKAQHPQHHLSSCIAQTKTGRHAVGRNRPRSPASCAERHRCHELESVTAVPGNKVAPLRVPLLYSNTCHMTEPLHICLQCRRRKAAFGTAVMLPESCQPPVDAPQVIRDRDYEYRLLVCRLDQQMRTSCGLHILSQVRMGSSTTIQPNSIVVARSIMRRKVVLVMGMGLASTTSSLTMPGVKLHTAVVFRPGRHLVEQDRLRRHNETSNFFFFFFFFFFPRTAKIIAKSG